MTLLELAQHRRVLVTCGLGGVGKTTVSAAIALRTAIAGKKVLVITMDPAKRLANALGLDGVREETRDLKLGDQPYDLTGLLKEVCEKKEIVCQGHLFALMPDTRKTFENFIHQLTPNQTLSEKIIRNPIFQIFSKDFSGANEYMALEKLYRLHEREDFDLIILDTPPSRNAVNFLNAPRLLSRFFDERLIQWLVLPANRLVSGSMRKALSLLEKLTGSGFMGHLLEFCSSLFEISESFATNLKRMTQLLESQEVGFLLVMSPTHSSAEEAVHFIQQLTERNYQFDGLILNRSLSELPVSEEQKTAQLSGGSRTAIQLLRDLQEREKKSTTDLSDQLKKTTHSPVLYSKLPELSRDVHSLEDLLYVAIALERIE